VWQDWAAASGPEDATSRRDLEGEHWRDIAHFVDLENGKHQAADHGENRVLREPDDHQDGHISGRKERKPENRDDTAAPDDLGNPPK
jgi:hypothetical protein